MRKFDYCTALILFLVLLFFNSCRLFITDLTVEVINNSSETVSGIYYSEIDEAEYPDNLLPEPLQINESISFVLSKEMYSFRFDIENSDEDITYTMAGDEDLYELLTITLGEEL